MIWKELRGPGRVKERAVTVSFTKRAMGRGRKGE